MSNLHTELKEMFIKELNIEDFTVEEWADDLSIFGDEIGLDSLDAVEIVVLVEKHYDVTIANAEEGKEAMVSINSLVDFIAKNKKNG